MAMTTSAVGRKGRSNLPARRLFNVDEYYRMAETGILRNGERVELIEGEILEMAAIGNRHSGCVIALNAWFGERVRGRVLLAVQSPVRLSDRSEPEPDLMLLRPPGLRARTRHGGLGRRHRGAARRSPSHAREWALSRVCRLRAWGQPRASGIP